MKDDSIARAGEIKGELLMVWGRQDPHIPTEGRMKVLARLNEVGNAAELARGERGPRLPAR
jgi:carboxymethylenebutenolidase